MLARVATMPRSLAVCASIFVGACSFEADYAGGGFRCDDGRCPAGLECSAEQVCGPPADAAVDTPDAEEPALTCVERGILTSGVSASGNTMNQSGTVSSMCNGFIMNGRDAVYQITVSAGDQLRVEIIGSLRAYVIPSCVSPAPACLENAVAISNVPINVSPAAGDVFVIVDHEVPNMVGSYSMTATIQ
jgi:hypothetical protein